MDSECDLDIIIERASPPPPVNSTPFAYKFYIKIYKNGNVHIKQQGIDSFHNMPHSSMSDLLAINDGVPFPPEIISMLKFLLDKNNEMTRCLSSCRNIFESIKILQQLVKARNSIEPWFSGPARVNAKIGLGPWLVRKSDELEKVVFMNKLESASKDKKISELERQVEQICDELGKERHTICQLLSDGQAARLGADKKISELEKIVTHKHRETMTKDKKISELERIVSKNKLNDPSDAELDIRAKEGAKKHVEAKAKLQKIYDERPIINLMD